MSLHLQLQQREAENRPVRIGLIGAGKFGSMYLAQIPRTPGVHLVGIADLNPAAAHVNLARVGWKAEASQAVSLDAAIQSGRHPCQRRLAGAGAPSGDRHHCRMHGQSARRRGPHRSRLPQRQTCGQCDGRSRRVLRAAAGTQGGRRGRPSIRWRSATSRR